MPTDVKRKRRELLLIRPRRLNGGGSKGSSGSRAQVESSVLTREEELVGGRDGAELPEELAVKVLEAVALVDDDVLPLVLLEVLDVAEEDLVARDHCGEGARDLGALGHVLLAQGGALVCGAVVEERRHGRAEALDLGDPVWEGGEGPEDEEGPVDPFLTQVGEEPDGLALRARTQRDGGVCGVE